MNATATPFTVILCEGYHDRAFLAGALVARLGWKGPPTDASGRVRSSSDSWGVIKGGDFGFTHDPSGAQLRLRPCHGHSKIPDAVRQILNGRQTHSFDRLIINYDGDKGGHGPDFLARISSSVDTMLNTLKASPIRMGSGHWSIDGGRREVMTLVWHTSCPTTAGVPDQQCLERLICASASAVWPERIASLGAWLDGRPNPTYDFSASAGTVPKSHSWALMGGWFADHGCDDFFKELWSHGLLAKDLQARLSSSGGWDVLTACARPLPRQP